MSDLLGQMPAPKAIGNHQTGSNKVARLPSLRTALFLVALMLSATTDAAPVVRFFVLGDMPYTAAERGKVRQLLAKVSKEDPPFLVHVGDIKGGNEPCSDQVFHRMVKVFKAQPAPVVFTPGDNDWTDCHRKDAGGYDPNERLAALRQMYFDDVDVLKLQDLEVSRENAEYPENFWFFYEGVLFATLHLVGSDNNLIPGDPEATEEIAARSEASREHLRAAVRAANAAEASAFVLLFHADPGLEKAASADGFLQFRRDLTELLQDYPGPILAIHGDTHKYRFDHPLQDPATGKTQERFTRLEVPGSPTVGGVWVTVDPESAQPFSAKLVVSPDSKAHPAR